MSHMLSGADSSAEVNKVDRVVMRQIKAEWRASDSLRDARVATGRAIRRAIGDAPLKTYGDKGLIAGVCSGEKVPDYLARIVADRHAKQRLLLALAEDDSDVVVTTEIRIKRRTA